MNTEIADACVCWGLYDDDNIIGFCGVLHQPHKYNNHIKRCSRLVILPDYQGIGLGYKFLTFIADMYQKQGYDFSIVTSAKNLIMKLYSSNKWLCQRISINKRSNSKNAREYKRKSIRNKCKTASFFYKK